MRYLQRKSRFLPWSARPRPSPFFLHDRSAAQLSALPEALSYSPLTLPGGSSARGRTVTLARRDLFDARFQLLLAQGGGGGDYSERDHDEKTVPFVDAPADLVPGAYEGGLKTWECALDLAAYLDREDVVFGTRGGGGSRVVRGLRVLEVSFF